MHCVQVMDKAFHGLVRIFLSLHKCFLYNLVQMFFVDIDLQGSQGHAQCFAFQFRCFDGRQMFGNHCTDSLFFYFFTLVHLYIEADE